MKSKIKVGELLSLEKELVGIRDQRTNATIAKGLLQQKIDGDTKYDLLEFLEDELVPNKQIVEKLQNEYITELGEEGENGSYQIPHFIDAPATEEGGTPAKIPNPALNEFNEKMEALINKEVEVQHSEFTKEKVLNFTSEEVYPAVNKFLRLIKKQSETK